MEEIKNCITCANFAWWDGDYCCIKHLNVLSESKDGSFNDMLMENIKTDDECHDYKESYGEHKSMYLDILNEYIKKKKPSE